MEVVENQTFDEPAPHLAEHAFRPGRAAQGARCWVQRAGSGWVTPQGGTCCARLPCASLPCTFGAKGSTNHGRRPTPSGKALHQGVAHLPAMKALPGGLSEKNI